MARFIEKKGKIVKSVDEAASLARKREEFSGTLVSLMDGGKGRRYAGRWHVKYANPASTKVIAKTYTVYSYGDHWPMYVWDDAAQAWYGNRTKCFSRTTNKHANQIRPGNVQEWFSKEDLQEIVQHGVANFIAGKMGAENNANDAVA